MSKRPFYISLVQNLAGYFLKVESSDECFVREYAVENLGKMWCSVYDKVPAGGMVIGHTLRLRR